MKKLFALTILFFIFTLTGCTTYSSTSGATHINFKKIPAKYVAVKGGQIEYYRFGKGSPIVLIPGYITDVSSWNAAFLAALAQKHDVIVFNNRNVGRSIIHEKSYDTFALANDTYQLIQALHLQKPAVLGYSMGGMIAQQFAASHPDSLSQLILINTAIAGRQSIHPTDAVQKKMLNIPVGKLGRYFLAIDLFFPSSAKLKMAFALAVDRFKPTDFKAIEPRDVLTQQQQLIMNWVHDDAPALKLKTFTRPVLILNGKADIVIPPQNSIILVRTLPHAQLWRWQEGGHGMIYQYPQSIGDKINDFLAGKIIT